MKGLKFSLGCVLLASLAGCSGAVWHPSAPIFGSAGMATIAREKVLGKKVTLEIECAGGQDQNMYIHVGPIPEPAQDALDANRSPVKLSFDGGQLFTEGWMRDDSSGSWELFPWPFAALLREMAYSRELAISFMTADGGIPYMLHFNVTGLKGALRTLDRTCPDAVSGQLNAEQNTHIGNGAGDLLTIKRQTDAKVALDNMESLLNALSAYSAEYSSVGYPQSLAALGGASPCTPSTVTGCLVDDSFVRPAGGSVQGYIFTYNRVSGGTGFTLVADPLPGNGERHFFADESGVIRYDDSAPATRASPPERGRN